MKAVFEIISGTIDRISGWAGGLAAVLIIPLVLVTCYEVIARYVFGAPTTWAFEMGYMLTGASFVFGCAYTLRDDAHIRIDVFYNKFPVRVRAFIMVVGYLCLFLPAAWWISFGLWEYAWEAYESGERSGQSAWNPRIWPFRFILCSGFALLALQATAAAVRHGMTLVTGIPHSLGKTANDIITSDEAI